MKLMTKTLEAQFNEIGMQRDNPNPTVVTKFFHPLHPSATWYATEYNPESKNFYGYVENLTPGGDEWGYFSLYELENTVVHGLPMERDLWFVPIPITKCCMTIERNSQPELGIGKSLENENPTASMEVDVDL